MIEALVDDGPAAPLGDPWQGKDPRTCAGVEMWAQMVLALPCSLCSAVLPRPQHAARRLGAERDWHGAGRLPSRGGEFLDRTDQFRTQRAPRLGPAQNMEVPRSAARAHYTIPCGKW